MTNSEVFRQLLPRREPQRTGRPRVEDRVAFNAIVFVLFTGIAWRHLPPELGCSPATAHRRLQEWQRAGVWQRLHRELLAATQRRRAHRLVDGVIDGSHVRALQGGLHRALAGRPCPTGSKHHLLTDATGIPLAVSLTGGNRNDVTQLLPLIDGVEPVRGKVGGARASAPSGCSPTAAMTTTSTAASSVRAGSSR